MTRLLKRVIKSILPDSAVNAIRRQRAAAKARALLRDCDAPARALGVVDAAWRHRIDDVLSCPDNAFIPRVPGAGRLEGNLITMHNGIRVSALGYYGSGILNMLVENKGVHEPQEERAFMEIIKLLPAGSTMLELGAYWGFYSLWLLSKVSDAQCYLVEPDPDNLVSGQMNFRINGKRGVFENALVGAQDATPKTGVKTISVDAFCARHAIRHLQILHADIQGAELAMLDGAKGMLSQSAVDYVFISTHSDDLHYGCIDRLRAHGYTILAHADKRNTYSHDGLLIARSSRMREPATLTIAGKTSSSG